MRSIRWKHTDWLLGALAVSLALHLLLVLTLADYRLNPLPSMTEAVKRFAERAEALAPTKMSVLDDTAVQAITGGAVAKPEPSRGPIAPSDLAQALGAAENPAVRDVPFAPGVTAESEFANPAVASPAATVEPEEIAWAPRQEVMSVVQRQLDAMTAPEIHPELHLNARVPDAPDVVPPVMLPAFADVSLPVPSALSSGAAAEVFDPMPFAGVKGTTGVDEGLSKGTEAVAAAVTDQLFSTVPQDTAMADGIAPEKPVVYLPIDDRLQVAVQTFRDEKDPKWVYYRMLVQRSSEKSLPVVPKDVIFVQDVSGSITDERLEYCRRGLEQALTEALRAEDRFMIAAFRDSAFYSFDGLRPVNGQTMELARMFIRKLKSHGGTDLFVTLRELFGVKRDPQRPLIVVVVTDGRPTVGMVESTRIIGEFTRLNDGALSVYTFGTQSRANTYLLDMLSYCNRGVGRVMKGNRWDIPSAMTPIFSGIRNPVMSDVAFVFDVASASEVFPRLASNLYVDQPLELFGRCPAGQREVACQIRGQAGTQGYDVVFRLDVSDQAEKGPAALRERWAQQKMYHFIAEYARNPKPELMQEMRQHAAAYNLTVPYRDELGR